MLRSTRAIGDEPPQRVELSTESEEVTAGLLGNATDQLLQPTPELTGLRAGRASLARRLAQHLRERLDTIGQRGEGLARTIRRELVLNAHRRYPAL